MTISGAVPSMPTAPIIRMLSIERYRGIAALKWWPTCGMNVILGGGDVGKTTILEAIALLLSPTYPTNLADSDYHRRDVKLGFSIEGVFSLPDSSGVSNQRKLFFPWEWTGDEARLPRIDESSAATEDPVYRFRVRGTEDLELVYEVLQPDGSTDAFPVTLRRAIGLVRLGGDDRNDRDLRLVQGSALDRLLSDKALRSRVSSMLARKEDLKEELGPKAQAALTKLDTTFRKERLPSGLDLAITGGQGISIGSLIGLTAQREDVPLPLASWGAGTRRLAALMIAEENQSDLPITMVDEIERGLEPYRQRFLMDRLQAGKGQIFVTTHSPAALAAASNASLWFVDHAGQIGSLDAKKVATHRAEDPEAFLSRLTIVAEGATETGFVTSLLEKALAGRLASHGIYVSNGGGHDKVIDLLDALAKSGIRFGGFADDENRHSGRWKALHERLGALLFRWECGSIEPNIIGVVPEDKLEQLIQDPTDNKTGMRLRTLADRLEIQEKAFASLKQAAGPRLKGVMIEAALGKIPPGKEAEKNIYKSHEAIWFKTIEGGRELCDKMFSLGLWPDLRVRLLPFCNAVRQTVDLSELPDLIA